MDQVYRDSPVYQPKETAIYSFFKQMKFAINQHQNQDDRSSTVKILRDRQNVYKRSGANVVALENRIDKSVIERGSEPINISK